MKKPGKISRFYARDVIGHSILGDHKFFFCPKVELIDGTTGQRTVRCIGKKIDITDQLQQYLLKKYRTTKKPDPRSFTTIARGKRS